MGTVIEFISSRVGWWLEVIVEVMTVSTLVDVRPVSTVEIRPGIRVAVCCDVATGGIKSHYPHDPALPAAVKPPDVEGKLGVVS